MSGFVKITHDETMKDDSFPVTYKEDLKPVREALDAWEKDLQAAPVPETAAEEAAEEKTEAKPPAPILPPTQPGTTLATESAPLLAESKPAGKAPAPTEDSVPAGTTLKGPLPDDFPGRAALAEAGITTYGQLRKAGDVTEIPGIGAATEAKIQAALNAPAPA